MKTINTKINKQHGAALITALFFLIILTMLALSSMNMNIMDEKMASNSQQKNRLFQTAESALVIAFTDADTYSSTNTAQNPYVNTASNLDSDMTATYSSVFLQKTGVGFTENGSDQNIKRYFFEIDVNTRNAVNTQKNITAGIWREVDES